MHSQAIDTVDRGQYRVARRTRVAAPAEELFAMLANPHRHHEVDGSGTVQPEVIGPRELLLGDKFTVGMRLGGVPYRMTSTVTDLVPGRVVEWEHPFKHRWRWEFEPQEDGSTLVTEVFDYSTSRSPRFIERIKAPERDARSIEATLHRLRSRYPG